jgi:hypothetical protein
MAMEVSQFLSKFVFLLMWMERPVDLSVIVTNQFGCTMEEIQFPWETLLVTDGLQLCVLALQAWNTYSPEGGIMWHAGRDQCGLASYIQRDPRNCLVCIYQHPGMEGGCPTHCLWELEVLMYAVEVVTEVV